MITNTISIFKLLLTILIITIAVIAFSQSSIAEKLSIASVNNSENKTSNNSASSLSDKDSGSVLKMSRSNVLMNIPLMKAYENGNEIFFIATDASDNNTAIQITKKTGLKVNFAPSLSFTPQEGRNQAFVFTNGINGSGPMGFQIPVVDKNPREDAYSPLWQINLVEWNDNAKITELRSVEQIMDAETKDKLKITPTEIVVNHPAIKWQGGSLQIRQDNVNDNSPYTGGQITNIDIENMTVTFVAHRGWGPDGKTIYYIVTDAAPEMPAQMMGVPYVRTDEILAKTPASVDLFQFTNGINGSGPMGFQAGIGAANPDDTNYSPMWRISFIEWNDPSQAKILETLDDINAMADKGLIIITPALEGKHVVNCPFFDPSTVFEHSIQQ